MEYSGFKRERLWNIKHRPGRQPHCGDQSATPSVVAGSELLRCRLPPCLRVTFHDREQFLPIYTRPCSLFKTEMRVVSRCSPHVHTHPGFDTRNISHLFFASPTGFAAGKRSFLTTNLYRKPDATALMPTVTPGVEYLVGYQQHTDEFKTIF